MFTETEIRDCNGSFSQSVNVGDFKTTTIGVQSSAGNPKIISVQISTTQKLTAYNKSIRLK